ENADIGLDEIRAADSTKALLLQDAQELGLGRFLHLRDFVEEERSPVGHLEAADLARDRAGEGAALVAEEIRLDQIAQEGGGVERHEGDPAARGQLVDRARDELLARAALAGDEHGDVRGSDLLDDGVDLEHLLRDAPQTPERPAARQLLSQAAVLFDDLVLLACLLQEPAER